MFHCTVHLQGKKGERGDSITPSQGVRGARGDAGLPGLPGELVFLVISFSALFSADGFSHRIKFL
jgi:hypothetical protein